MFVIVYSLQSFSENPPVITIVCLFMILFFSLIGVEEVDLFHDRLVLKDFSIFSLIFGFQRKCILFDEVESFSMQPYINETSEGIAYVVLRALIKKRRAGVDDRDIIVTGKDGSVENISIALGEEEACEIVERANELLKVYKRKQQNK